MNNQFLNWWKIGSLTLPEQQPIIEWDNWQLIDYFAINAYFCTYIKDNEYLKKNISAILAEKILNFSCFKQM